MISTDILQIDHDKSLTGRRMTVKTRGMRVPVHSPVEVLPPPHVAEQTTMSRIRTARLTIRALRARLVRRGLVVVAEQVFHFYNPGGDLLVGERQDSLPAALDWHGLVQLSPYTRARILWTKTM